MCTVVLVDDGRSVMTLVDADETVVGDGLNSR